MSFDEAFVLLSKYSWSFGHIQDDWFNDEMSVRIKSGLSCTSPMTDTSDTCGICLSFLSDPKSLSCNHRFCRSCFKDYLEIKIKDGQDAVQTRCPGFRCPLIVPRTFFLDLVSPELGVKFSDSWCVNSLVQSLKHELKFCPNPHCDLVVHQLVPSDRPSAVTCGCGFDFCFACTNESHLPTTCAASVKWSEKNSSESQNVSWIIANTKPCPKCRKPIEKNQGCNHMTCRSCRTEFCWICLKPWSQHGGSFYTCNLFTSDTNTKQVEQDRAQAKSVLEKYLFHFERFMNHQKAANLARKDLVEKFPSFVSILHDRFALSVNEVEFIKDALTQVVACRQVLKWTYVYAYYMDEESGEHAAQRSVETRELFEYLQKNLEEKTDKLHELVEKDLDKYVAEESEVEGGEKPSPNDPEKIKIEFLEFRSHVCNYLAVTKNFCSKIVSELNIQ